ncbi:MAG TPA: deoxyribodipyrimidine photo-lyase [Thermomicrobiales bacterium]|nr:deoxyribodipyrimidine photo-lyase [Thermomicrobiales bacterium]
MIGIRGFVGQDDPRMEVLRDGALAEDAACVMLWVQRAQRARANPAANVAVEIAGELGLPVVAVFCLVPAYPGATLRAYHFMAEGLRSLPDAFAARGIGWKLVVGEAEDELPEAARSLAAAAIVTDANPLRIGRQWRAAVAERLQIPMLQVESDAVVPPALFPKVEHAPRTIRPRLQKQFDRYLAHIPDPPAQVASPIREGEDPLDVIRTFDINTAVGPAPDLRGGSSIARQRLATFVADRLARYDQDRNRADIQAGTSLSPWLHYGQIGPTEMAIAVQEADAPQAARNSLIDELITQRELAINLVLRNPDYDRYEGLPEWGRATLERHAGDPRPVTFTREEFERAETDDPLWNASMLQMIHEGIMPNRLRMYWAKQILRWSASPREAWEIAVSLNDTYFVDGRDANSYANLGWCIGGRHDRPFGPEKPIFGLVRPMGMAAMKRTFDVDAYIRKIHDRWGAPAGGVEQQSLDL